MRRVYLAGPISGLTYKDAIGWRSWAAERLREHRFVALDPMRGKEWIGEKYGGDPLPPTFDDDRAAFSRDLRDIDTSDAVLIHFALANRASIGTIAEMGYAHARGLPIYAVLNPRDDVHHHLFVHGMTTSIQERLEDAVDDLVNSPLWWGRRLTERV